ncbi:hypothetical protein BKA70DRAFT_1323686 [Coprinopsis sp. MPI-PUGE-AT-0042]|nr:hypothetical protein BKA70DRAFT_1323686 [Coprinopsis sp. MPI-PUGE-AT-0042]
MGADFPPLGQPENAPDASARCGSSYTPPGRILTSLRCLYASLAIGIPIFIFQTTPWCDPSDNLWLFPIGLLLNTIYSVSVVIVILQGFAHPPFGTSKDPASQLPAFCKLGVIIPCFLLVVYWVAIAAVVIFLKITQLVTSETYSYRFSEYGFDDYGYDRIRDALAIVQGVLFAAQLGLLLAVGILGSQERKDMKRQLRAAT